MDEYMAAEFSATETSWNWQLPWTANVLPSISSTCNKRKRNLLAAVSKIAFLFLMYKNIRYVELCLVMAISGRCSAIHTSFFSAIVAAIIDVTVR